MTSDLHSPERLASWDKFVQQMSATNQVDRPEMVVRLVVRWTKAQPLLTKKLLQYILAEERKIAFGKEAAIVEKVIRNRLIKEFKHDELTLPIRKLLYIKDLTALLKKTRGKLDKQSQIYLENIQAELGLSDRHCLAIKKSYLASISAENKQAYAEKLIPLEPTQKERDSYQDLVELIENSPIYDRLTAIEPPKTQKQRTNWSKPTFLWLGVIFCCLLWLGIKNFQENTKESKIEADVALQDNNCVNSIGFDSPRMSLGEKLLTQNKYSYFPIASKIALYEAAASFERCDYEAAANQWQASLKVVQNNPEALIYLNNTKAIGKENFKIAAIVPLVNQPEIAWEILRGVAQAQTEINRQEAIAGRQLLVQIVDDDNDPAIVRQIASQLAADSDILAVIGHNDSSASFAGSDIYQQQGLMMISPTSSTPDSLDAGEYIMQTTPSISLLAEALATYAVKNSQTRIAVCLDSQSSDSTSFVKEFTANLDRSGKEVIGIECDFAKNNFNPVPAVERAISLKADALLLAPSVSKINEAVTVAQANQNRLPLLGNHSLYTSETVEIGKSATAKLVLPVPWLLEAMPDNDFVKTSKQLWGGRVNWRTAMAYDATQVIIQGLMQSDSRAKLKSVLTAPSFSVRGTTGKIAFQQGDRLGRVQLAYVDRSKANPGQYRFLPLKQDDNRSRS